MRFPRTVRLLAMGLLVIVLGGCVTQQPVSPDADPAPTGAPWRIVTNPSGSPQPLRLHGIAVISPDDVWAVGDASAPPLQPLMEHWNGSHWSIAQIAPLSTPGSLNSVAAAGAADVWAVGWVATNGHDAPLIEHWDGHDWKQIAAAPLPVEQAHLRSVVAFATNDVWAVGEYEVTSTDPLRALVEHWDGSSWRMVAGPTVSGEHIQVNSISGTSASDVWIAGSHWPIHSTTRVSFAPLLAHWDGTAWHVANVAGVGAQQDVTLLGVAATSPVDVWAVGSFTRFPTDRGPRTLAMHWDGTAWHVTPSPNLGSDANSLVAVAALSPADVWAVGIAVGPSRGAAVLIEHWDRSKWTVASGKNVVQATPTPVPPGGSALSYGSLLWAVGGAAPRNSTGTVRTLWAVGKRSWLAEAASRSLSRWIDPDNGKLAGDIAHLRQTSVPPELA